MQKGADGTSTALAAVIAIVILIAAVYGLRALRTHRDPYVPGPAELERHRILYELLARVDGVCRRNGIQYWPVGGSLLGAVRHGGMIPWDDDIDLAVWEGDVGRLRRALAAELGGAARWWVGKRCDKITPGDREDTVIDIFASRVAGPSGAPRVEFANPAARKAWPAEYFTADEFGRADKPLRFGPVVFRAPARPCSYLDRVYPGWDRRGYNTEAHSPSVLRRAGAAIAPASYVFDPARSRRPCG